MSMTHRVGVLKLGGAQRLGRPWLSGLPIGTSLERAEDFILSSPRLVKLQLFIAVTLN